MVCFYLKTLVYGEKSLRMLLHGWGGEGEGGIILVYMCFQEVYTLLLQAVG